LDVSGTSHIGGALDTSSNLLVNGNTFLKSNLDVTGTAHFGGTIDTSGSLIVNNSARIVSNLDVSGSTTLSGSLNLYNDVYLRNLSNVSKPNLLYYDASTNKISFASAASASLNSSSQSIPGTIVVRDSSGNFSSNSIKVDNGLDV
jgi:hypothetical protein